MENKKKKILIVYATAGIGHKKAAMAVYDALLSVKGPHDVEIVDILHYTNTFFKKSYPSVYLFMINKMIFIWGFFYYFFNFRYVHMLTYPIRKFIHFMNGKRFAAYLTEYRPDILVSTHFMAPDICAYVKAQAGLDMEVINIVTDYRAHSFWVSGGVDHYVVGHAKTKKDLLRKWHIKPESVSVLGIPVEPKFSKKIEGKQAKAKLGLSVNNICVLLLSGGYGVGPIFNLLKLINNVSMPVSVIVVCGHNADLYKKVMGYKKDGRPNIINLGFVNNIDELMSAADIYVGKAGGISVTEALVKSLPVILVKPIPGQEERNARLIVREGGGILLNRVGDISKILEAVVSSDGTMSNLKNAILSIRRPNASVQIAELIMDKL